MATWRVSADPRKFREAYDWFGDRHPRVRTQIKGPLGVHASERAWSVARVTQLSTILDVFAALMRAIRDGQTLDEFKRDTEEKLRGAWGKRAGYMVETVFRTNMQSAYNSGRYQQATDPDILKLRPYSMLDVIKDGRTSNTCMRLIGLVLPTDELHAKRLVPPLHHRCRTTIRTLRRSEAKRIGIKRGPPRGWKPDGNFGGKPFDVDRDGQQKIQDNPGTDRGSETQLGRALRRKARRTHEPLVKKLP